MFYCGIPHFKYKSINFKSFNFYIMIIKKNNASFLYTRVQDTDYNLQSSAECHP